MRSERQSAIATEEARAEWNEYRSACFMRPGPLLVWAWSARHGFDLATAGLHLGQLPGSRYELGTHALALILPHVNDVELSEWHLVPLTRLTAASIETLQPVAAGDLGALVAKLAVEQRAAQEALDRRVRAAHLWRIIPGAGHGALQ